MEDKAQRLAGTVVAAALGPLFLVLAVLLAVHSGAVPLGLPSLAEVGATAERADVAARLAIGPQRQRQSSPPVVLLNGFRRDCQDCHRVFTSHDDTPRHLRQHQDIRVNHGINSRCFNCHHPADRNQLVLRDGSPIPYAREEVLCSQCHGTTYRDWQQGMHGKTLGYWSAAMGEQRRLVCTECHDPHQPAFRSYSALPGPRTFRMGAQHGSPAREPAVDRNPLRTWSRRQSGE